MEHRDSWILLGWVYTGISAIWATRHVQYKWGYICPWCSYYFIPTCTQPRGTLVPNMCEHAKSLQSLVADSLWPYGLQSSRFFCPWNFPGKNNWRGLPFPPPGDLPDPGIEPMSLISSALAGGFFTISATWEIPDTHHRISTAYCCELRYWCWEWLKVGEGDNRGWDGWRASQTRWTWVWVSSGSWWRTGKSGVLQSMGSDMTEWLNWTDWRYCNICDFNICKHTLVGDGALIGTCFKDSLWCDISQIVPYKSDSF